MGMNTNNQVWVEDSTYVNGGYWRRAQGGTSGEAYVGAPAPNPISSTTYTAMQAAITAAKAAGTACPYAEGSQYQITDNGLGTLDYVYEIAKGYLVPSVVPDNGSVPVTIAGASGTGGALPTSPATPTAKTAAQLATMAADLVTNPLAYAQDARYQQSDGAGKGDVYVVENGALVLAPVTVAGALSVEPTQLAGERNVGLANQYFASVPECNYTSVTSDTSVSSGVPGLVFGVLVTVATATDIIQIRDSATAGAGTVVLSIPATTAIGTFYNLYGAKFNTGVYVDFTGTGTLVVLWRPQ